MKFIALMLIVGCSGPAFEVGESNVETVDRPSVSSEAGMANDGNGLGGSKNELSNSGAGPIPEGNAGHASDNSMGGVIEPKSDWMCRYSDNVCQCYVDPSVFEPGWLDLKSCPSDQRCTLRDDSACVCWDTDSAYQNALTVAGTYAVSVCPVR